MFKSKFLQIISVMGIIALLVLQYIWVNNAYQMVQRDLLEKSKDCLKESVDDELFERVNHAKLGVVVQDKLSPGDEVLMKKHIDNASEIMLKFQEGMNQIGHKYSIDRIDTILQKKLLRRIGFIPPHSLQIIKTKINHDTIYKNYLLVRFDTKQSIKLTLTSPNTSILTKAKYIFIISIVLVFFVGVILILQFKSMMRDKKFTAFMKDYTKILAHEMRTPINNIYMIVSRIISTTYDKEKNLYLSKECLNQCSKMLLGIDNILLVAKSEHTKLQITKSNVDICTFLEKIVDKYKNQAFLNKNLTITTEYATNDSTANIDPNLMENVFVNLIENAIKYSGETVDIRIFCKVENNNLRISVKDNGFGIPKSDIKDIFQLFERGKNASDTSIKGFGIGLYYVQKVIVAHQGQVSVSSEEGFGTEFTINIPM